MKKLILLLLLIPYISNAQWDDTDKHYVAGAAISTVSALTLHALDIKYAPAWGALIAFGAGIGKEIIDHHKHGMRFKDESNEVYYDHIGDAFATASGGMTATITLFIILKPRHKKSDDYYLTPKWTY